MFRNLLVVTIKSNFFEEFYAICHIVFLLYFYKNDSF